MPRRVVPLPVALDLFKLKAAITEWQVSDDYVDALVDAVTSLQSA